MKISGTVILFGLVGIGVVGIALASSSKADPGNGGGGGGGGGGGVNNGGGGLGGGKTPDPNPKPNPGPGVGNLGGVNKAPVAKPPPDAAFTWTPSGKTCLPAIWNLDTGKQWARLLGEAMPKNSGLSQQQLLEYGGKAAMGKCWPPPADIAVWKSSFTALYELGRAYLQGLVTSGAMTAAAAQKVLDQVRAALIAKGGVDYELDPYLNPKP